MRNDTVSRHIEDRSHFLPARRTLGEDVYDAVLALIMDDILQPGSRVSIDGLARQLNVSPTPVRESVTRLEAEGLIQKNAQQRYRVAPLLDEEGLRQLFQVRALLEPAASGLAASRLLPSALDELRSLTLEMENISKTPDKGPHGFEEYKDFADRDAQFHHLIAAESGNDLLSDAVMRLRSHMHLYRLYFEHGIAEETVGEHEAIIKALEGGDGAAAEAAMLQHISRSYSRIPAGKATHSD